MDGEGLAHRTVSASASLRFLSRLSETEQALVRALGHGVSLEPGEDLTTAGAPQMLLVETGLVWTLAPDMAGGALIGLAGPGDLAGLAAVLADRPAPRRLRALTRTTGLALGRVRFRALLAERPGLWAACAAVLAADQILLEGEIACGAAHRIEPRLAKLLLRIAHRLGEDHFHVRQEDLAQMLGVQRTTVSAVAHGWKTRRLVTYSRGGVRIHDRRGLETIACGCPIAV